jgi:hypothetical protein
MKWRALNGLLVLALLGLLPTPVAAQSTPTPIQQSPARLDSAAQIATTATSAATLTLTPNGGESVYVYELDVQNCSNATGGTVGAVLSMTTTNISGSPAWTLGTGSTTAGALGGPGLCQQDISIKYPTGLRAQTPGTPVTFVLPTFAANQTIRVNVSWRSAPAQ